jgi:hypothetical protein
MEMNWIPLKDQKPDITQSGHYLVTDGKTVRPADWWDEGKKMFWVEGDGWNGAFVEGVTHWMPMPPPPRYKTPAR